MIEAKVGAAECVDLNLGPRWARRSLAELVAGLGQVGTTRVRYRFDQATAVGQRLNLNAGANVPFVRSVSVRQRGEVQTNVEYEKIGCKVDARVSRLDGGGNQGFRRR